MCDIKFYPAAIVLKCPFYFLITARENLFEKHVFYYYYNIIIYQGLIIR